MGKKLLVADDSLTIQKVIKLALSADGYDIQTVSDGNDALQQVAVFHPDVVLIDVGIPGRTAFEVKKAMNEDPDLKRIPVVLMSSAFEKVDEAKVALLQFEGRLTKPFDPTHLRQALQQALATRGEDAPAPEPTLQFSSELSKKASSQPEISLVTNFSKKEPVAIESFDDFKIEAPAEERTKTFTAHQSDPLWNDESSAEDPHSDLSLSEPTLSSMAAPPRQQAAATTQNTQKRELTSITLPDMHTDDIRHLTESTVRMGALDEFGAWNIGESSKSESSSSPLDLEPLSVESNDFLEENRLDLHVGDDAESMVSLEEVVPPKFDITKNIQRPKKEELVLPVASVVESDREPTSFIQTHLPNTEFPRIDPKPVTRSQPQPQHVEATHSSASPQIDLEALTQKLTARLEEMVKEQVQKSLEQMAKKALPDIAEKVVRQEIRRILESIQ